MYKVRLHYIIYSEERNDPRLDKAPYARATRETELPFPPFVGLHLDSAHDMTSQSIVKVTWRSGDDGQYFVCDLEDVYPRHAFDFVTTYRGLTKDAINLGWSVHEFRP